MFRSTRTGTNELLLIDSCSNSHGLVKTWATRFLWVLRLSPALIPIPHSAPVVAELIVFCGAGR